MGILFHFYTQFKQSLGPHSPFLKFLAIKIVIGLSYMQEVSSSTPYILFSVADM